jgi:hypothetical protein
MLGHASHGLAESPATIAERTLMSIIYSYVYIQSSIALLMRLSTMIGIFPFRTTSLFILNRWNLLYHTHDSEIFCFHAPIRCRIPNW